MAELMASEMIDGGWTLYKDGRNIGHAWQETPLLWKATSGDVEVEGSSLNDVTRKLSDEVWPKDTWTWRPSGRTVRPRLRRGRPLTDIADAVAVLETMPSIWWRDRPLASGFVLGMQTRTVIDAVRQGWLHTIERSEGDG